MKKLVKNKRRKKKKNIAEARGIAMYLSRMMTDESLEEHGFDAKNKKNIISIGECAIKEKINHE